MTSVVTEIGTYEGTIYIYFNENKNTINNTVLEAAHNRSIYMVNFGLTGKRYRPPHGTETTIYTQGLVLTYNNVNKYLVSK